MAAKSSKSTGAPAARKPAAKKAKPRAQAAPKAAPSAAEKMAGMFKMPDPAEFAKYAKTMTPQQAFELYRANAKLALEVIENAIESTAKLRKLQFQGEEQARSMQRKTARSAAEAGDVQSLMAVGQSAAQEAVEQSMQYWGQMFDLIVEIQKRLFSLIEAQASGLPGAKEAKAAMAMAPDTDAERRFGNAGRDVVGRFGVRVDAEGDGRLRPDDGEAALSAARAIAARGGRRAVRARWRFRTAIGRGVCGRPARIAAVVSGILSRSGCLLVACCACRSSAGTRNVSKRRSPAAMPCGGR
jgi:hypothetical protein